MHIQKIPQDVDFSGTEKNSLVKKLDDSAFSSLSRRVLKEFQQLSRDF